MLIRRCTANVAIAIFLLGLPACDADVGQDDALLSGPEDARELAEQMAGRTTDYQQEILADGVVDRPEYEAAVAAVVGCTEASGLSAEAEPAPDGRGTSFSAVAGPDVTVSEDVVLDCMAEFFDQVDIVWSVQQTPTDPEQRAEDLAALRDCLLDAGEEAPAGLDDDWLGGLIAEIDPNVDPDRFDAVTSCTERFGYVLESG